ncbi:DUF1428 domain-containing protein [Mesonia mobilis]|uniref:RNA signal recognition particle n=1 Tax=Mesonia mobilis TaxID=369791 RepID=A0ABQ3BPF2_9FLAO|nr:DUF1428 domain-containing protein [Mesonia mobilis]MBQ0739402.1 DUF1428 domain-containing protein [Aquimarina celericrescens]GGZ50424.1 RNA signal recognition particle [Mesonia mobilis]
MPNYIDGFVFPIPKAHLEEYKTIAEKVAEIWKEYGALAYLEFLGDDLQAEGTASFIKTMEVKENEQLIFGWVVFPSKEIRDEANKKVPQDPRMETLVKPLIDPEKIIFDANRMLYGGFRSFIEV